MAKLSVKYYIASCTFRNIFTVKYSVSGAKSVFSFIWNWWTSFWQHSIMLVVVHFALVQTLNIWVSSTTLIMLLKANVKYKCICWSNYTISACFKSLSCLNMTRVLLGLILSALHCNCNAVPGELPSKFTTIHMELLMWCKHQTVLVYKSCTVVTGLWGRNIVLCKELIICSCNHNLCEKE